VEAIDVPGTLRRIRRLADLSQRELASRLNVSKSSVAAMEGGSRGIDAGLLARAAREAGLRLVLLDGDGTEVAAMSADSVTDLGRRRFPAHLDTRPSDERGAIYEPRRDRPETAYTFTRDRQGRDWARRTRGSPEDHHPYRPGDSPWGRKAARRQAARQREQEAYERLRDAGQLPPLEPFVCTCPPECAELDDYSGRPVHAENCPCSCDVA